MESSELLHTKEVEISVVWKLSDGEPRRSSSAMLPETCRFCTITKAGSGSELFSIAQRFIVEKYVVQELSEYGRESQIIDSDG